ncbi:MAG: hypothetical protein ABIO70_22620 [Pseudomonadota bacterium]
MPIITLPILLSQLAAASLFLDVGAPVAVEGTDAHPWIRTFPAETGWWILHSAGNDYLLNHLGDDLVIDDLPRTLTDRADLVDHAITRCPDGGFLHASFSQTDGIDTQWVFRYDRDWNLLNAQAVVDGDGEVRASDPPVVCSEPLNATGYSRGVELPFRMVRLSTEGASLGTLDLDDGVMAQGSGMLVDEDAGALVVVGNAGYGGITLRLRRYDLGDLHLLEARDLEVPFDSSRRPFWPQGVMRVGDYVLVAYVVTTLASGTAADSGDIWLSAYDDGWNLVESTAVVEEPVEWEAYMRPGLSRKGEHLLVSFDHHNGDRLAMVILDLDALGVEGGDSGLFDTGTHPSDSDGPQDSGPPPGDDGSACGCGTTAPLASSTLLASLAAWASFARRRRSR